MLTTRYKYGALCFSLQTDSKELFELIDRDVYPYFVKDQIFNVNENDFSITLLKGEGYKKTKSVDVMPVLLHPRDKPLYGEKTINQHNVEVIYNPHYPATYEISDTNAIVNYYEDIFNGFIGFRLLISPFIYRLSDSIDTLTFHAASVEKNGQGLMFVGPKGSGKTSSVISMVLKKDFGFMSNDYSLVRFLSEDNISLYGTPEAIRLGEGTYDALKSDLKGLISDEKVNSKYLLHLRNINREIKLTREAILNKIFLVNIMPEGRENISKLTEQESYAYLKENVMELTEYTQPQIWKSSRKISSSEIEDRIRLLSSKIEVYKLEISYRSISEKNVGDFITGTLL